MTIIDGYIMRAVIGGTLLVLAVLDALSAFMFFVDQLDNIGTGSYGLQDAVIFVLLKLPQLTYEMFPIAALLGALLGLGQLAQNSELMVMRASGVSIARLGRSALLGGLVLLVLAGALGEFLAPPAEHYAVRSKALSMYSRLSVTAAGIWARDQDVFVNVRQLGRRGQMGDISIYHLDDSGRLERVVRAESAQHDGSRWLLGDLAGGPRQTRSP